MWYFSFSFLINLQKCQQFCIFLSIWGAVCTLMRNFFYLNDFSKWLQYNGVKHLRGSEYFPYPLYVYIYIYFVFTHPVFLLRKNILQGCQVWRTRSRVCRESSLGDSGHSPVGLLHSGWWNLRWTDLLSPLEVCQWRRPKKDFSNFVQVYYTNGAESMP